MYVPPSKVGQRATCNASCADALAAARDPAKPWHLRLKERRPGAVEKVCDACGTSFWLPACKAQVWHTCSTDCAVVRRQRGQQQRRRQCETCGGAFVPSQRQISEGRGRFCSQACNTAGRAALAAPDAKAKAADRRRALLASGEITPPSGPANKRWRGGPVATRLRRRDSGAEAAGLRAYRAANPDRVREFAQRRSGRKTEKLPYGTLPKIRKAQGGRCAICRVKVVGPGHFDHIIPLARGGTHEPRNIQLLCAPCNLRKSDRDPITHMQSLGRLL